MAETIDIKITQENLKASESRLNIVSLAYAKDLPLNKGIIEMNDKVISFNEFLIYKKSKADKVLEDEKNEVFSSAVFCEEDLNKINEMKENKKCH